MVASVKLRPQRLIVGGQGVKLQRRGKAGRHLHSVSLPPTGWESEPIPIDKADKLSVMLDFVF